MNKHIELVKRWQAGEYFSAEALRANANAAEAAYSAAVNAAEAAAWAVEHWVKRYEELTNDK